jgi:hypothetical protein
VGTWGKGSYQALGERGDASRKKGWTQIWDRMSMATCEKGLDEARCGATSEISVRGSQVPSKASLDYIQRPRFKKWGKKLVIVAHTCNPSYSGGGGEEIRRIAV